MLGFLTSCMDLSWLSVKKPADPTTEETTSEETTTTSEETTTTEEETTSEETATEETTTEDEPTVTDEMVSSGASETSETSKAPVTNTPAPKKIGKTKVTNAYKKTIKMKYLGKVTTRIPKITIEGVSTKSINNEIYKKFKKTVKKNKVTYSYYIGKTYVSLLITVYYDASDEIAMFVYNVSRKTGKKLSKAEFLKILGVKQSTFESKAKKSLTSYWTMSGLDKMDNTLYKNAISKNSLSKLTPFVNSKGKRCYLFKNMKIPSGIGHVDYAGTF